MAVSCPSRPAIQDLSGLSHVELPKRRFDGDPAIESAKRVKIGPFEDDDDDDDEPVSFPPTISQQSTAQESHHAESSLLQQMPYFQAQNAQRDPVNDALHLQHNTTIPPLTPSTAFVPIRCCSGTVRHVRRRALNDRQSYEKIIAARSTTAPGKAARSYYGIDIHSLLIEAARESTPVPKIQPAVETPLPDGPGKPVHQLWTEKYRARNFKDLIGDDRTHRSVLRWLKSWDPIVFPGLAKPKVKKGFVQESNERPHRKLLVLTGPPGLGKTTLAHVCAKQVGYEVLEINASDERSRNVVKGRVKDAVGTENVKGISVKVDGKTIRKPGRPVCVVIDEVDGVVSGSSAGGEGGFIKALIDLVNLDQRNSTRNSSNAATSETGAKRKKSGDRFRLMRPLILICNDIYHPSLRPLRTASIAEIVHVRRVPFDQVVTRTKTIFEREGIQCDGDGVRKLCEISWGSSSSRTAFRGSSEGDIRGVLVEAEWIAHKLRYTGLSSSARLTKRWIEQQLLHNRNSNESARGLCRGGTREIVERVFLDGAGFPHDAHGSKGFQNPYDMEQSKTPVGVAELRKRAGINRLRELVDSSGEYDRCVTDCFLAYPTQTYQDDTIFSKPNAAYDWLHFHDLISSRVFSNQAWELNPYLSQATIAFHHLFASASQNAETRKHDAEEEEEHPFSGPRADYAAFEAERQNRAILTEYHSSLSASLYGSFHSTESMATELIPNLTRMLAPDIKPTIVGISGGTNGIASVRKDSERALVRSTVSIMNAMRVTFEKARVETETGGYGGWVYRMEPALDKLTTFSKVKGTILASSSSSVPVRYAVRQTLDQEYQKDLLQRQSQARQARLGGLASDIPQAGGKPGVTKVPKVAGPEGSKKDFFGRIITTKTPVTKEDEQKTTRQGVGKPGTRKQRAAWITYHEGFSNAVRKKITMAELLSGL
ncbi:hypothetical protein FQN57_001409 [Myotisia sp. PD_48]|nr:hypothetical protein FQN57_001409 [Myotisia sp. PD_48]